MTKKERLRNLIDGSWDGSPLVSLWRYFPEADEYPEQFAKATVDFQNKFDFDFVKVMTTNRVWTWPWNDSFLPYDPDYGFYPSSAYVVRSSSDWCRIKPIDIRKSRFWDQIEALRIIRNEIGPDVPLIATAFSPVTAGIELAGMAVHEYLREGDRNAVEALRTVSEIIAEFCQAAIEEASVDGFFYAVQSARTAAFSYEEYHRYSLQFDNTVFSTIKDKTWFNMLHLCKDGLIFKTSDLFPTEAVNWFDRGNTGPAIAEIRTDKVIAAGINHEVGGALQRGDREGILAELRSGAEEAHGRKLIFAPGCCMAMDIADEDIRFLVNAVRNL